MEAVVGTNAAWQSVLLECRTEDPPDFTVVGIEHAFAANEGSRVGIDARARKAPHAVARREVAFEVDAPRGVRTVGANDGWGLDLPPSSGRFGALMDPFVSDLSGVYRFALTVGP